MKRNKKHVLDTMTAFVRAGEATKAAELLSTTVPANPGHKPTKAEARLFELAAARIGSALVEHEQRSYFWLASEFLTQPKILPYLIPDQIKNIVGNLFNSNFPKDDDQRLFATYRNSQKSAKTNYRSFVIDRLIEIAGIIADLDNPEQVEVQSNLEDAFFSGFRELPDELRQITIATSKAREDSRLTQVLSSAYARQEQASRPPQGTPPAAPKKPTIH